MVLIEYYHLSSIHALYSPVHLLCALTFFPGRFRDIETCLSFVHSSWPFFSFSPSFSSFSTSNFTTTLFWRPLSWYRNPLIPVPAVSPHLLLDHSDPNISIDWNEVKADEDIFWLKLLIKFCVRTVNVTFFSKKRTEKIQESFVIFFIFLFFSPDITLTNYTETLKLLMTLSESHEILLGGSVAHL